MTLIGFILATDFLVSLAKDQSEYQGHLGQNSQGNISNILTVCTNGSATHLTRNWQKDLKYIDDDPREYLFR